MFWEMAVSSSACTRRARPEPSKSMKHAEKLIGRIIFVEGAPRVDHLNRGRPHRLAKGTAGPDQQIGIELCLADQTKE